MNFMSIPSLEHIALVKVTALLWNQHDVITLIKEFKTSGSLTKVDRFFPESYNSFTKRRSWLTIQCKVKKKVPELPITTDLKDRILSYTPTVGLEILKWMDYHLVGCCLDLDLPNEYYWTPRGMLDKKIMAETLIKNENINVTERYKLACIYCIEKEIPHLWNQIPESKKILFYDLENQSAVCRIELVTFWGYFMKGEVAELGKIIRRTKNLKCSAYRYMFRYAANEGNRAATEYFFQKLKRRNVSLLRTAFSVAKKLPESYPNVAADPPKKYFSEVLFFLMSQMSSDQQVKLFKKFPTKVLDCLLEWPWQSFFVGTINCMWNFIPENKCFNVLMKIVHKDRFLQKEFNYRKMFSDVWQQTPDSHKRYVMQNSFARLLHILLQMKDKEILNLVIQDAKASEKKKYIFSNNFQSLCGFMIHHRNFVEFFIQLLISSKDELLKFKQNYESYILRTTEQNFQSETSGASMRAWNLRKKQSETEFLKLLNDLIQKYDSQKEDNSSEVETLQDKLNGHDI